VVNGCAHLISPSARLAFSISNRSGLIRALSEEVCNAGHIFFNSDSAAAAAARSLCGAEPRVSPRSAQLSSATFFARLVLNLGPYFSSFLT
jgi:hypothetical protein